MLESTQDHLFSIKMRAARAGRHISGAEKIVSDDALGEISSALLNRAFHHELGRPDFINLKMEEVSPEKIQRFDALPVRTIEVPDAAAGLAELSGLLAADGIGHAAEIVDLLCRTSGMRGAILLDADTMERLEPDPERGIRVTFMDEAGTNIKGSLDRKNHYAEAVVLASKVAHAPHLVGELCISDDPNYTTGYFASLRAGYVRITHLKSSGSPNGGRVFLFRGSRPELAETIQYLEHQCVLVRGVLPSGGTPPPRPDKRAAMAAELESARASHLYRTMRDMETAQESHVRIGGRDFLMLASNNYLALAAHPFLKQAAEKALSEFGTGSGGSRLTTGSTPYHTALERRIAAFKGTEDALVYATGYMANVGIISALCGRGDVIFSDELNHASIIDGCRLSRARIVVYAHNDMDDLETKIRAFPSCPGLVVSDAVFSMDGDILNLPRFLSICKKHGLLSMIDEAHSTGVLGRTGRGIVEYFGLTGHPDVQMGTLSKAIGAEGGFAAADLSVIEYLRNKSRSFIFSTAFPASAAAAASAGFEFLDAHPEQVRRLQDNIQFFCSCLRQAGIAASSESAIIPIVIGGEESALAASSSLYEEGIVIPAIRYPTVKRGSARLRAALMASHTRDELAAAAQSIARAVRIVREN